MQCINLMKVRSNMKLIEKIKDIIFKIKDYDRLAWDYIQVLSYATNGRMNNSDYYINDIKEVIDEAQEAYYYQEIQRDLIELIENDATWDDIKEYLERL
jgi:hypothetical protein